MSTLLVTAGCTGFPRAWKAAGKEPASKDPVEGRWEGSWRSEVNEHHGRLRCLLQRTEPAQYEARFHAKYKLGFIPLTFGYRVPLTVQTNVQGTISFQSEVNLGWYAGGVYRYRGTASSTHFHATYESKHDHGIFEMTRPGELQP